MNYFEKTLLALNEIKNQDSGMVACFAFGSFVSGNTSVKNYKEIRVFDGKTFVLSKFNLTNIYPDVDIICVSENPEETKKHFDRNITDVFGHFVTVNIISKDVFAADLFSDRPTAPKRIVLYRKLLVIKGQEYLDTMKQEVVKTERPIDKVFQEEFDFRKEYLRLFAKNNVPTVILTRADYEQLFPHMLQFINGNLDGGFPKDRIKLVYPSPMQLKAEVDLSVVPLTDII